jgi:hypothetical protein
MVSCDVSTTGWLNVVMMAIAIPVMPRRFPRRALLGEESPFNARIKQTEATRYAIAERVLIKKPVYLIISS